MWCTIDRHYQGGVAYDNKINNTRDVWCTIIKFPIPFGPRSTLDYLGPSPLAIRSSFCVFFLPVGHHVLTVDKTEMLWRARHPRTQVTGLPF